MPMLSGIWSLLVVGKNRSCGVLGRLLEDRSGVTAIEYGLIAALIAVAAVTVMGTVGTNLTNTFTTVSNSL
jgi:pilus assembly protein Flp/PilA